MKIHNVTTSKFAEVETDIGNFRVWSHGAVDLWIGDEYGGEWGYFPEFSYDEDTVAAIKAAAFEIM